ncbi:hypothetical protein E2P81_ATG01248 [Venturia nashicola]|nr:hypothetical protein E2P81_ATG01248 [Venturia nashicola]
MQNEPRPWQRVFSIVFYVMLFVAGCGFGALSTLTYLDSAQRVVFGTAYSPSIHPSSHCSSTEDEAPKTPVPNFPLQTQPLKPMPDFTTPPEEEPEPNLWRNSLPRAMFIHIDNPEEYNLGPGMPTKNGTERKAYGVTWTHEYHCLMMIRDEFWSLVRGTSKLYHDYGNDTSLEPDDQRKLWHLAHCMDFIRQLTLCQADMTVEVAAKYPATNGKKYHIDGYGTEHTCTDKNALYTWMNSQAPERYIGEPD